MANRTCSRAAIVLATMTLVGCEHHARTTTMPAPYPAPKGESVPYATEMRAASRASAGREEVLYGAPSSEGVAEALVRVRRRLEGAVAPRIVARGTRVEYTDYGRPAAGLMMDTGVEGKFNPISYPFGVIHSGMLNAAEATGDKGFSDFTAKWFQFYGAHYAQLAAWPGGSLELPTPPTPPAQSPGGGAGGGGARAQPDAGRGNFGGRVVNPFRSFLAPDSLDACGSMTTSMIKARLAHVGPDLSPIIDRAVDYVHTKQFRLADGTLARHRPVVDSIWADDMYMGVCILAQAGKMTGDAKYFDDAANEVLLISKHLWVPENHLLTHGWNTVAGEYHPHYFWGRANGWCLMAMAELLTVLPEGHKDRAAVLKQFRDLAQGVATVQAGDGLWHQMLDRPDSYTETSASGMFVFALARGVNKGWLDAATYGACAQAGWNGLYPRIDAAGHITGTCVGTSYAGDYIYYYHRPATDDIHGYGPVLLAGSEIIKLLENPSIRSMGGTNGAGGGNVQFSRVR